MENNLIRLLKADEIECRVSIINEKGLSLLLYKDARVDQKILDETFGIFCWKRSHQCIEGNLYCTVEIFDKETEQWVAKQDVGTTGYAEKEKSQASDSFKRACFNWGIGRELYTAPFIWIPAAKTVILSKEASDKDASNKKKCYYCNDHFSVSSIQYNGNREISALVIENDKGQAVYAMKLKDDTGTAEGSKGKTAAGSSNKGKAAQQIPQKDTSQKEETGKPGKDPAALSKDQMDSLQAELDRTGVSMEAVQSRYKIQEPGNMSEELYGKVMNALKNTKSVKAA